MGFSTSNVADDGERFPIDAFLVTTDGEFSPTIADLPLDAAEENTGLLALKMLLLAEPFDAFLKPPRACEVDAIVLGALVRLELSSSSAYSSCCLAYGLLLLPRKKSISDASSSR